MNYTVKIIDTKNNDLTTKVERAVGSSIILEWMGGDKKDDLFLVGSRLSLTMVGLSMEDGQYLDLFTGDETRYRVPIEDEEGNVIWQGFLLPDSYGEPYTNSPILVDFTATDGLGRLKGKYLPEDFYNEEKSTIEVISQCLRLTGLGLPLRFAPAIENSRQKDYNKIYIDTAEFKKDKSKDDAYKILDDLLQSMLCTLYQADNFYNIEGFNVRNRQVYKAKVYASDGTLIDEVEVTRLKKHITGIQPTNLTMQAPYGVVNVTHEKELLSLPETLTKEKNDGWIVQEGAFAPIVPTDWINSSGMALLANADNGEVLITSDVDGAGASLRARPYISKDSKYKLSFKFKLNDLFDTEAERQNAVDAGWWKDPFYMTIRIYYKDSLGAENIKTLYANALNFFNNAKEFHLEFDVEGECTKNFSFISNYSGLLDITISDEHSQFGRISSIAIEEATLEQIGQEEEYISEILNPQEYTSKKEIELVYGNDKTAMSRAFRLQKLRVPGNSAELTTIVNLVSQRDGFWWATVNLLGANLIKDNIDSVSTPSGKLNVLDVVYNYLNSDEHAIKLSDSIPQGTELTITVYDYNTVTEDRTYWEQWTDTFAKIERKQYPDVVSSVLYNLCKAPVFKVDLPVKNNIKFNDFLDWNFRGDKNWMLTNCRWDLDQGFTDLTAGENFYAVEQGANLPPIVELGEDIYIGESTAGTGISAEAFDPDGYITSYEWEEITNTGARISTVGNSINVSLNLNDNFWQFKVTVTDNDGATASDTISVYRISEVDLSFTTIKDETYTENGNINREIDWRLNIDDNIGDSAINFKGMVIPDMKNAEFRMYIYKNGQVVWYHQGLNESIERSFSPTYEQGDEFIIETWTNKQTSESTCDLQIRFEQADFVRGTGTVTGIPVTLSNTQ